MTRLLSLPCSRRTPTKPPSRPKPYPNTLSQLKSRHKGKNPQKPPRQTTPCSAWLTGKPSEPRARARKRFEPRAEELARKYALADYTMFIGSGALWGEIGRASCRERV